jgi:hypothetical protein
MSGNYEERPVGKLFPLEGWQAHKGVNTIGSQTPGIKPGRIGTITLATNQASHNHHIKRLG